MRWRGARRIGQYAVVAWGLIAGAVWFAAGLAGDPGWALPALAGCYLVALLAAVCAIDGRYGIIPDSVVLALAVGGALQAYLLGEADLWWRGCEAFAGPCCRVAVSGGYRWLRGYDGLGFGDVKFVAAGILWIGIEGIPGLLLIAVASALASLLILRLEGHDLHGNRRSRLGLTLPLAYGGLWLLGPS